MEDLELRHQKVLFPTLERRSVFTVRFVGFLGAFSLRERKT